VVKRNFLVVSADAPTREALAGDLRAQGFTVTRAANGAEAKRVVASVSFDAVLVESHLPDMTSKELRKVLKKARPDCRVVTLTSFDLVRNSPAQLTFGAGDYLIRAEQVSDLLRAPYDAAQDASASALGNRGSLALIQVIDVLVGLLELDDQFFGGSSHKVMELARETAVALSADEETVQEVVLATLLRDTGKVGVGSDIFAEPGPLTEAQKEEMQERVSASLRLFEHIDFPWKVLPIVRHHHERYDGKGYPDGLKGREIPMGARIVAIVDAYIALTSDRTHRDALAPELALDELVRQAGRQFDPEVVEAFQAVMDKRLTERKPDRTPSVLLADQQEEFRRLLRMGLLNDGLQVQETSSYQGALRMLLKDPPDLVLVDVDADANEAFQLLQEIREDKNLCRVPFAFLSGNSDRVLKIRALRQGVDDYLPKTTDLEELVAHVQNILTRESIRRDGQRPRARRGISGDLENLSLPDIVQTLVMGMKSACVTIASDGRAGKIWFDNGAAKHAQADGKEGEQAFFEMVRWSTGEFVIEHGVACKKASLKQDAMFLLMEGLRLMDEAESGKTQAAS
jgi:response regulator RpfG family c-di-GMP phosphodiesterase